MTKGALRAQQEPQLVKISSQEPCVAALTVLGAVISLRWEQMSPLEPEKVELEDGVGHMDGQVSQHIEGSRGVSSLQSVHKPFHRKELSCSIPEAHPTRHPLLALSAPQASSGLLRRAFFLQLSD